MRPVVLAEERCLPVLPVLEPLLAGGELRRGSVVSIDGPPGGGATSLALALLAGPSAAGSWVAAVGVPWLGLRAAAEAGLVLSRVALVPAPDPSAWAGVLAALVDAFDMVLARPERRARPVDARRLTARARERGAVLVLLGPTGRWREGPDVALRVAETRWEGLGCGHGRLRARRVVVEATGRRQASRTRRTELWLPTLRSGAEQRAPADPDPEGAPTEEAQASMRSGAERRALVDPDPEGAPTEEAQGA